MKFRLHILHHSPILPEDSTTATRTPLSFLFNSEELCDYYSHIEGASDYGYAKFLRGLGIVVPIHSAALANRRLLRIVLLLASYGYKRSDFIHLLPLRIRSKKLTEALSPKGMKLRIVRQRIYLNAWSVGMVLSLEVQSTSFKSTLRKISSLATTIHDQCCFRSALADSPDPLTARDLFGKHLQTIGAILPQGVLNPLDIGTKIVVELPRSVWGADPSHTKTVLWRAGLLKAPIYHDAGNSDLHDYMLWDKRLTVLHSQHRFRGRERRTDCHVTNLLDLQFLVSSFIAATRPWLRTDRKTELSLEDPNCRRLIVGDFFLNTVLSGQWGRIAQSMLHEPMIDAEYSHFWKELRICFAAGAADILPPDVQEKLSLRSDRDGFIPPLVAILVQLWMEVSTSTKLPGTNKSVALHELELIFRRVGPPLYPWAARSVRPWDLKKLKYACARSEKALSLLNQLSWPPDHQTK
jgi:hypothetical protein